MHALLRVSARPGGTPPPAPDATLRMADYADALVPRQLAPGWRLVEATSAGPAEDVAEFARLRPGRRLADVLAPRGGSPAPADDPEEATVGGSTRLARGARAFVWLHLVPGTYVVQCPLRAASRRSHLRQGMIAEFEVQ
jgi:hypothetical protein